MPSSTLVAMLNNSLVWPGTLLVLIGAVIYIRDMFRGQTRPDLITWLLWTVAPLIAFSAQVQQGVGSPALLTLAVALCPAAVFLAGLRRAHYRITWFSLICGGMSVGALTSWQITGNGNLAIVLSIAADALAALPTLVKSYRHPRSETPLFFAFCMAGSGSTLLVIPHWTVESSAFAIYIFALYTLLYALAQSRMGDRLRSRKNVPGRPKTDKLDSVLEDALITPSKSVYSSSFAGADMSQIDPPTQVLPIAHGRAALHITSARTRLQSPRPRRAHVDARSSLGDHRGAQHKAPSDGIGPDSWYGSLDELRPVFWKLVIRWIGEYHDPQTAAELTCRTFDVARQNIDALPDTHSAVRAWLWQCTEQVLNERRREDIARTGGLDHVDRQ